MTLEESFIADNIESDLVVIYMSSGCNNTLSSIAEAWLQPNFCAATYTSGLYEPRGLHINSNNDELLLVEKGSSRIVRLDNAGTSIVPVSPVIYGLSHGIEVSNNGYIYASTPTTVYRVPYEAGQRQTPSSIDGVEEVIVGMDRFASGELGAPDGHTSRTLAFDPEKKWLYVSIGSEGNVDTDSHRARIRRFYIASWEEESYSSSNSTVVLRRTPMEFNNGEIFADGLRNEVGLAFDSFGVLWGVENGADNLYRSDLGGDVHNDNPAEELNRFSESNAGRHWGYPYCWSEYCLSSSVGGMGIKGAGTIWAWPDFLNTVMTGNDNDGTVITDNWCRTNTIPSAVAMPSHSAPLGITFYNWTDMSQTAEECTGGFPRSMDKYAFIAFHGSWNRDPPTGYKVVFVPFDNQGNPTGQQPIDLFRHDGETAEWSSGSRPVDLQFDHCGRLYVTDDGVGSVISITYAGQYTDEYVPIDTDVADGPSCSSAVLSLNDTPLVPPPTVMPVPPPTPLISQGSNSPSSSETLVSVPDDEFLTSPPTITLPKLLDPPLSSVSSALTVMSIIILLCFYSAIQLIDVIR